VCYVSVATVRGQRCCFKTHSFGPLTLSSHPQVQMHSIATSVSLSVCLSVYHISKKTDVQILLNILYMSPVAVAQSSSDNTAMWHVLPDVLWMTSWLHIMEPTGQNQRPRCVSSSLPGGKVAVYAAHWLTVRKATCLTTGSFSDLD